MPQDNWPKQLIKPNGDHMTEMEACHKMFGSYKHPVMTNLYKLFTTYESGSTDELLKAGGNLTDRVTEEEKAEWMMETVMVGKIPELF